MRATYEADEIRLVQGDCLKVLGELARRGERFGGIVTDPPYSSGGLHMGARSAPTSSKYQSSDAKKILPDFLGDQLDQRSYRHWATLWLSEAAELLVDGGIVCLFTDWRQLPTMSDILQAAGLTWHGVASWDKRNARPRLGGFRQQCEFLIWGSKGKLPPGGPSLPGAFTFSMVPHTRRIHAAEKPLELMREILRTVAWREARAVLDPFAGSGTTLAAARELGMAAVGIEKSRLWAERAAARLRGAAAA